jgi:hypothetical protein
MCFENWKAKPASQFSWHLQCVVSGTQQEITASFCIAKVTVSVEGHYTYKNTLTIFIIITFTFAILQLAKAK